MGYVDIKREDVVAALADAWEVSFTSCSTIDSFLTARSKKYYTDKEEVIEDLEKLSDKDLSELFGTIF